MISPLASDLIGWFTAKDDLVTGLVTLGAGTSQVTSILNAAGVGTLGSGTIPCLTDDSFERVPNSVQLDTDGAFDTQFQTVMGTTALGYSVSLWFWLDPDCPSSSKMLTYAAETGGVNDSLMVTIGASFFVDLSLQFATLGTQTTSTPTSPSGWHQLLVMSGYMPDGTAQTDAFIDNMDFGTWADVLNTPTQPFQFAKSSANLLSGRMGSMAMWGRRLARHEQAILWNQGEPLALPPFRA